MSRRSPFHRDMLTLLSAVLASAIVAGHPVNTDDEGLALQGYDPVAYFVDGAPVEGKPELTAEHRGATYRFATEAHREAFAADPARYAPRYGGWCAYAMARGKRAAIDPGAFKIVDGKLYLNYSSRIQKKWEKDIPGYVASADEHWRELRERD